MFSLCESGVKTVKYGCSQRQIQFSRLAIAAVDVSRWRWESCRGGWDGLDGDMSCPGRRGARDDCIQMTDT